MENTEVFELDEMELRLTEPTIPVLRTREFARLREETLDALGPAPGRVERPERKLDDAGVEMWTQADADWSYAEGKAIQDAYAWMAIYNEAATPISPTSAWLASRLLRHFKRSFLVGFGHTIEAESLPDWAKLVLKQVDASEPGKNPNPLFCEFLVNALGEIAGRFGFTAEDDEPDLCEVDTAVQQGLDVSAAPRVSANLNGSSRSPIAGDTRTSRSWAVPR